MRKKILWRRALDWLRTYHPLIIAVTGTYGKSTTAAAIARVAAVRYRTRWTAQEAPDSIAVPLAILGVAADPVSLTWYQALTRSFTAEIADEEPAVLVLELAAHRPGDIDWAGSRLQPDITVVTNVGTANLDVFDSKDNIAHEVASLVASTKPAGTVIVNEDDELTNSMPTLAQSAAISFGAATSADVRLTRANRLPSGGFAIEVKTHKEMVELQVPSIIARHQLSSLVAALAVGHALNIPLAESARALHNFAALPGRTAPVTGKGGASIIDDSANATPESMLQALETLRAVPLLRQGSGGQAGHRRIAALGDIAHLGRETERAHRKIGRLAAQTANIVMVVGDNMRWAGMEALQAGVDVHHFDKADDAGKWLADYVKAEDTILVSGGREMHMNRLVERLQAYGTALLTK